MLSLRSGKIVPGDMALKQQHTCEWVIVQPGKPWNT